MLIKNGARILTEDGQQTYKAFGFTVHMHNRFFSGSVIFMIKYNYKVLDRKIDLRLKNSITHAKFKGLDYKFMELRLISIPKGK